MTRLQCKDIPDEPILKLLNEHYGSWMCLFEGYDNSITAAFPVGVPTSLVKAKMRNLIKRGLVDGCACGCRGDFEITLSGMYELKVLQKEKLYGRNRLDFST